MPSMISAASSVPCETRQRDLLNGSTLPTRERGECSYSPGVRGGSSTESIGHTKSNRTLYVDSTDQNLAIRRQIGTKSTVNGNTGRLCDGP